MASTEEAVAAQPGWYEDPWRQAPLRWYDGTEWTATLSYQSGWYPDPWREAEKRWFDGRQWTGHKHDAAAPTSPSTSGRLAPLLESAPAIVVIDVETTGLSRADRIVEIAMITLDSQGTVVDEFTTMVNPHRDVGATWIHGLTATMLADAPSFSEIAAAVASRMDGAIIAAHNAPFDTRMLDAELSRSGIEVDWGRHLDTLTVTRHKLAVACGIHGVVLDDAHCALNDARATAELLVRVSADFTGPGRPTRTGVRAPSSVRTSTRAHGQSVHVTPPYLVELAGNSHPEPDVAPYSMLLAQALADLVLTEHERAELADLAAQFGLSPADVDRAHRGFLHDLLEAALDDGVITDEELDRLLRVAALLDLPPETVTARTNPYRFTEHELPLTAGLQVCFTGEVTDARGTSVDRDALHTLAAAAGLAPVESVTKKNCDLLVAADSSSLSGKAKAAHRYGTHIADADAFLTALERGAALTVRSMQPSGVACVCEQCGASWSAARRAKTCRTCRPGAKRVPAGV
ncbi:exonuclease domain-containing protein [Gordonia phosphorivorans]|uniref:Exonuclease domain-containing protein n=1 Tax=Gordonia phosphorivorans TaxID=1056982 RepID=A0ABV6H9C6_9ACTN